MPIIKASGHMCGGFPISLARSVYLAKATSITDPGLVGLVCGVLVGVCGGDVFWVLVLWSVLIMDA